MQQAALAFHAEDGSIDSAISVEQHLRKATGAIHILNDINPFQRKLMNGLLYRAGPDLGDLTIPSFKITVPELSKLIGFKSKNVRYIKEGCLSLVSKVVQWHLFEENSWGAAALLADVAFSNGVITYSFAPQLRRKLAAPERWAMIDMEVIRGFDTGAGIAMYENCIAYAGSGQTPFFPIDIFRKLLGATNESSSEFKVMNRSVIKPAIAEVNKVSDMHIEAEFKRVNRQVVAIKLRITKSLKDDDERAADGDDEVNAVDAQMLDQLTEDFCLGDAPARKVMAEFPVEQIKAVMDYVGDRFTRSQITPSKIAPYFLSTMHRWDGSAVKQSRLATTVAKATPDAKDPPHIARQKAEELRAAELQQERKLEAEKRLTMLTADERAALDASFATYVRESHSLVYKMYQQHGSSHSMIKGIFGYYLQRELLDSIPE